MQYNLITALLFATATAGFASAQVTYDDFNGSAIDKSRWFQADQGNRISVSGGLARFYGRGHGDDFALLAFAGLDGDFDVVTSFKGYRGGGFESNFGLFGFGPDNLPTAEREFSVGMEVFKNSNQQLASRFFAEMLINGKKVAGMSLGATMATAGELRIQRTGSSVTVYVRPAGQRAWQSLGTAANYFLGRYVSFGIEVNADLTDGVDVECDKVIITAAAPKGRVVTGKVAVYGDQCHSLAASPLGYPYLGTSRFRLIAIGDTSLSGDPFVLALSVASANLLLPGAPGCGLYLNPVFPLVQGKFDMYGEVEILLPIPMSLPKDLTVFAQFAAFTNRNALGLATSNGMRFTTF